MTISCRILLVSFLSVCLHTASAAVETAQRPTQQDTRHDVVVYGGTSGGIATAIQVRRMGKSVVLLEPTQRIGGLTTGGLGQTDIGNKAAIGGISREFYQRIFQHYQQPTNWKWQKPEEYRSGGQSRQAAGEETQWTFEPSAALKVYDQLISEHEIPVIYGQRLDRSDTGVLKDGPRITGIRMENGNVYRGRMFVDATYEGDLMAAAGVSSTVGREANSEYGETLNGVQTRRAIHHQFVKNVDPYVTKGDPSSGLLPGVDTAGPGEEGGKDHRVQAYCFRMCLTDHPDNRLPWQKPASYNEADYELLFRNFEAGAKNIPWHNSPMPNRKTDVNNNKGFSTDFIGQNYDYPEAGYEQRAQIVQRHLDYQRGLMWTMANHPRVPEFVRQEISKWGPCKDEFEREDGWQQQLYIREARRMIGDYVMTQHNCQGRVVAEQPIGLAAYTMDSHNVQRHVGADGFVHNEGDVQVGGFSPYPIDYGSITPKKSECENLLVPVCLSATHIAFGSIRMEPVFMVLGQSAGTAAVQAIDQQSAVQDIDYVTLREQLEKDKQKLAWTGPKRNPVVGITAKSLPGLVLDDEAAERDGFESASASIGPFVDIGYRHDSDGGKGLQKAVFTLKVIKPGRYAVRLAYSAHSNRASNVPINIRHGGTEMNVTLNQRLRPTDAPFASVATVDCEAGDVIVTVSNEATNGYVLIDAVQLLPAE